MDGGGGIDDDAGARGAAEPLARGRGSGGVLMCVSALDDGVCGLQLVTGAWRGGGGGGGYGGFMDGSKRGVRTSGMRASGRARVLERKGVEDGARRPGGRSMDGTERVGCGAGRVGGGVEKTFACGGVCGGAQQFYHPNM